MAQHHGTYIGEFFFEKAWNVSKWDVKYLVEPISGTRHIEKDQSVLNATDNRQQDVIYGGSCYILVSARLI